MLNIKRAETQSIPNTNKVENEMKHIAKKLFFITVRDYKGKFIRKPTQRDMLQVNQYKNTKVWIV